MSTYVDCPHCGSEFLVSDEIVSSSLRCPDCLLWVDTFGEYSASRVAYAGYVDRAGSMFDDFDYQEGYDY